MFEIEINNQQSLLSIDAPSIRERLTQTLGAEGVFAANLSVAIVDDELIHAVNRDHLEHDYPTDVISFLYDEAQTQPPSSEFRGSGKSLDGELVISAETAIRESDCFGWNAEDELTLYLVHGLLHLCGYDDLSESEQAVMRRRERAILQIWGLEPHYDAAAGNGDSEQTSEEAAL
ncbi:MAG: rRNA maturation RNase YbeY [Planctomycetaceae bacterium]|nr:rRNA maturation RNase YbeY [Planctomycetaceae bacterium]